MNGWRDRLISLFSSPSFRSERPIVLVVLVADDAERVNHTRNDAQDREQDVDEEVCAAATIEENGDRWKKDR